jgi:hypothetical protein
VVPSASADRRVASPRISRAILRLLAAGLTVLGLAATSVAVAPTPAQAAGIADRPALPYTPPAAAGVAASGKKVFAHYMPSMPVSIDNKAPASDYWAEQYMLPTGENGKHAKYGAFVRDRPLGRSPRTGDFRLADAQDEVRQAIAGGIDGFSLDLVSVPPSGTNQVWNQGLTLLKAAESVNSKFKIMLMPDMSGNAQNLSPEALSDRLAELAKYPAAFRLGDGRLVVSPFLAEKKTATWWKQFISAMKSRHGITVAFVPLFLDERAYADSFGPISYGMSYWGARNPAWTVPDATYSTSPLSRAKEVVGRGKIWMQPVAVQDERPRSGVFDEALNTTTLRNSWELARNSGSQWVQLTTWNDYAEGTQFAPSARHGWSFLDINAYYAAWFKSGAQPTVTKDVVHVTHRIQLHAATPSYGQSLLMKLRGGTPAADRVEAITFLKAPGRVTVTSGGKSASCDVPAGVGLCSVALSTGTVKATVARSGATVASVTSPFTVVSKPYLQDLQYYAASSSTAAASATPAVATPVAAATVAEVKANADTYANSKATSVDTSKSASLASLDGVTSYLRFNLPAAPAGKKLTGAVLKVHTTNLASAGSAASHKVLLAGSWSGSALTWSSRPALTSQLLGTVPSGTKPSTSYQVKLDVAAVTKLVGATSTLAISGTTSDSLWLWSANYSDVSKTPTLVLTFS